MPANAIDISSWPDNPQHFFSTELTYQDGNWCENYPCETEDGWNTHESVIWICGSELREFFSLDNSKSLWLVGSEWPPDHPDYAVVKIEEDYWSSDVYVRFNINGKENWVKREITLILFRWLDDIIRKNNDNKDRCYVWLEQASKKQKKKKKKKTFSLIDPPVSPYSSEEDIKAWIVELEQMPDDEGRDLCLIEAKHWLVFKGKGKNGN